MADTDDVRSRIRDILARHLGVDGEAVEDEADLVDDLGADSLDVVELVMAVEEEFGVEISDEKAEGLKKVRDLVGFVAAASAG